MSTYGKLNLLLINSIYVVFFSLEMRRKLMQIKIYYSFFSSAWKETSLKLLQVAPAKNLFPSVYVIGTTCFDEYFLIRVMIEWQYFIYRFIVTQRFFATTMLLRSLKRFESVMCYVCYLHNNIAIAMMVIPKVQALLLKFCSINQILFLKMLFLHSFIFCESSTFFYINVIFQMQNLSGGMSLLFIKVNRSVYPANRTFI